MNKFVSFALVCLTIFASFSLSSCKKENDESSYLYNGISFNADNFDCEASGFRMHEIGTAISLNSVAMSDDLIGFDIAINANNARVAIVSFRLPVDASGTINCFGGTDGTDPNIEFFDLGETNYGESIDLVISRHEAIPDAVDGDDNPIYIFEATFSGSISSPLGYVSEVKDGMVSIRYPRYL